MEWRDNFREIYEVSLSWTETHHDRRYFFGRVETFDTALEAAQFHRAACRDFATWLPTGGHGGEVSDVHPIKLRKDGKESAA